MDAVDLGAHRTRIMIRSWISARTVVLAAWLVAWAAQLVGAREIRLRVYHDGCDSWMMDLSVTESQLEMK